jgi:hypothetical protein
MTNSITAGSILVEENVRLPNNLLLQSASDANGWAPIKGTRSTFEKAVQEAGWTFFFMAGEIQATALGSEQPKAIGAAMKRLIADVRAQHCNCIEISQVTQKSFLGVPYLRVTAHARHLQKGMLFSSNAQEHNPAPGFAQDQKKWKVTTS